jgi:preprotein translocase subunit YajC
MDATFLIILVIAIGGLWLMSSRQRKQQVITLESTPGVRTRWLRAAIAKKIEPPVEADEIEAGPAVVDPATAEAERIQRANDAVIDVPDDLSSLPPSNKDDDEDGKH